MYWSNSALHFVDTKIDIYSERRDLFLTVQEKWKKMYCSYCAILESRKITKPIVKGRIPQCRTSRVLLRILWWVFWSWSFVNHDTVCAFFSMFTTYSSWRIDWQYVLLGHTSLEYTTECDDTASCFLITQFYMWVTIFQDFGTFETHIWLIFI